MTTGDQLTDLCRALRTLLEGETRSLSGETASLHALVETLRESSADPRLRRLASQLHELRQRLAALAELAPGELLDRMEEAARSLESDGGRARLAAFLGSLLDAGELDRDLPQALLDQAMELTGAERGFLLAYLPQSGEAEVLAARRFATTHLPLEEYDFSRTVLREVLDGGEPVALDDAGSHPVYGRQRSVRQLQLKSVLALPLSRGARTLGALYLENNTLPAAFDAADRELAGQLARFSAAALHRAGLLSFPARPVVVDPGKAPSEIVTGDPQMHELLKLVRRVAPGPASVLLRGESGTGKELVARALHRWSGRPKERLIAINCAAIPEALFESQLFGYERGAFTGAGQSYGGLLAEAAGGTLFLDEIGELPAAMQGKLLRFLQSGELQRLGSRKPVTVDDVRLVAATHRDLESRVAAGEFQDALFYRLNVVSLELPPLRERRGDVALLADHFLEKLASDYGRTLRFESAVYAWLERYDFPGNVRELENLVHRLVALAPEEIIRVGDLPREIVNRGSARVSLDRGELELAWATPPLDLEDLRRRREDMERLLAGQQRELAELVLAEAGGNHTLAARRLGVHRTTIYKMLKP